MNSTTFRRVFSLALCASALTVLGCEGDKPRTDTSATTPATTAGKTGTTPMTDKTTMANEAAVQAIANSRCGRETRCNNVGAGKKWASAEACRTDLMAKGRDELKASECPGGIVHKELQECLSEISSENCDNPLDTIGRLAACRSSDLCKSTGLLSPQGARGRLRSQNAPGCRPRARAHRSSELLYPEALPAVAKCNGAAGAARAPRALAFKAVRARGCATPGLKPGAVLLTLGRGAAARGGRQSPALVGARLFGGTARGSPAPRGWALSAVSA